MGHLVDDISFGRNWTEDPYSGPGTGRLTSRQREHHDKLLRQLQAAIIDMKKMSPDSKPAKPDASPVKPAKPDARPSKPGLGRRIKD